MTVTADEGQRSMLDIDDYVATLIADAPPLTEEQRQTIAAALREQQS